MAVFRLPFEGTGVAGARVVANGNWDDTGGHHSVNQASPTDEQAYAWDILMSEGTTLLAARAGNVRNLGNTVADDTCPPSAGAGNFVWIVHTDGTLAAYLHLKNNSILVSANQWVPQGFAIADSGATGNTVPCPTPHLHYDLHSYVIPGPLGGNATDLGCQQISHFEDQSHTSFRPIAGNDLIHSNNVEGDYRHDGFRFCTKCHALFLQGGPSPTCPAGGFHTANGGGNYTLSYNGINPAGQTGWKHCVRCDVLFFGASANSVCPEGGAHLAASTDYALLINSGPGQPNWKWCNLCAALWFNTSGSVCPGNLNGPHSLSGSGDYRPHVTGDDFQMQWRLCNLCRGLFYGPNASFSKCPGNNGNAHSLVGSKNYGLAMNYDDAPGQRGWRWCNRCQGMWVGVNAGSVCPAGAGGHSSTSSGEYWIIMDRESDGPGEKGWRWCGKCQGIWLSSGTSHCPAGGDHISSGSNYRIEFDDR